MEIIRAGTKIIADIEGSSFIVVTHGILYILYGNLTVRLHEQRHRFVCFSLYIRKVCLSLIGKHIEITPDTGFTITAGTEIKWSISLGKAEVLIHPVRWHDHLGRCKRRNDIYKESYPERNGYPCISGTNNLSPPTRLPRDRIRRYDLLNLVPHR